MTPGNDAGGGPRPDSDNPRPDGIGARVSAWARRMKRDAVALWFACRDPRAPWTARVLCAFVVAYALSPIDLIPDFIPVLGYLDEVLLLPGLLWLCLRLMPPAVMADARDKAQQWLAQRRDKPRSLVGALIVVTLWIAILAAAGWAFYGRHHQGLFTPSS